MARIRTIKPELPHSESLGRCSRDARLAFICLFTQADDAGRLRGSARMLASLLFPYDDDAPGLMDGWLCELEREGCIRRYVVGQNSYIDIPKWTSHQKIDKPSKSKIPECPEASTSPRDLSSNPRDLSSGDQGSEDQGSEDQGGEWIEEAPASPSPNHTNDNGGNSNGRKQPKHDVGTWVPCEEARLYAIQRDLDPGSIGEQIRDWAANATPAKRLKLDPLAFWRGWCRREAERRAEANRRSGNHRPAPGGIVEATAAVIARHRARQQH